MQLRVGESPGIDGIPAEFYHQGEEAMFDKLQDLFTNCWGGGGGEGLYRRTSGTRSLSMEKKKKKKRRTTRLFKLSRHLSAVH